MMNNFLKMQENMEAKLGRDLYKKEVEFLKWLYKRHMAEQRRRTVMNS